jgi:hypothetical protein
LVPISVDVAGHGLGAVAAFGGVVGEKRLDVGKSPGFVEPGFERTEETDQFGGTCST